MILIHACVCVCMRTHTCACEEAKKKKNTFLKLRRDLKYQHRTVLPGARPGSGSQLKETGTLLGTLHHGGIKLVFSHQVKIKGSEGK